MTPNKHSMCGSWKFCKRWSKFDVFLVDEGRDDPNTTKSGPTLTCQQNTIKMVFRWCVNVDQTLNADLAALWFFRVSGPVLLRNPIFFVFFRGGGGPCPPSGSVYEEHYKGTALYCDTYNVLKSWDNCGLDTSSAVCWSVFHSTAL